MKRDPKDELPLNPIMYYILFTLIGKILHGYEIKKRTEAELEKTVPTATLYRHLRKMLAGGMIEEAEKPIENDDSRRQYFKLTKFGQAVYSAERERMSKIIDRSPVFVDTGKPVYGN